MAYRGKRKYRKYGKKGGRLLKKVSKMISKRIHQNTELKYYDITADRAGVDFSGTFWNLTNMSQGDSDTTRDGDKATPKSLNFSFDLAAGDATNHVRVIFFLWKQNTISVTPTIAYLLSPYQGTTRAIDAPYNWDTRSNFKIIKDFNITLDTYHPIYKGHLRLNLKKMPKISFDSGTTNGNGQIYCCILSDSGAAPNPSVSFVSRLHFVDS